MLLHTDSMRHVYAMSHAGVGKEKVNTGQAYVNYPSLHTKFLWRLLECRARCHLISKCLCLKHKQQVQLLQYPKVAAAATAGRHTI